MLVVTLPQHSVSSQDAAAELLDDETPLIDSSAASQPASSPETLVAISELPIHGRYPVPLSKRSETGDSSTSLWRHVQSAFGSGFSTTALVPPLLAVRCGSVVANDTEWQLVDMSGKASEVKAVSIAIPSGNLGHRPVVNLCTAAAYVIAAATLVRSAFKS